MSPAKLKKWKEDALNDGWALIEETVIPGSHDSSRKVNYRLIKDGFEVSLWISSSPYGCSFYLTNHQGCKFDNAERFGQEKAYNWEDILALDNTCSVCQQKQEPDTVFIGFMDMRCPTCEEKLNQRRVNIPVERVGGPDITNTQLVSCRDMIANKGDVVYIEFRSIYGKRSVNVVKKYRTIVKAPQAYWEDYNGTNQNKAEESLRLLINSLEARGFTIDLIRENRDWRG